jgi:hypothetical protein
MAKNIPTPEDIEAKASQLMSKHGLKSIWRTSDDAWFSRQELANAHYLIAGGENPQVFNQKTKEDAPTS